MSIAELESFVEDIRTFIPLSRVWYRLRNKGEKEEKVMSFEETAAQVIYPTKMDEKTRGYVAQHEIPFSVVRVSDPWEASYPDGKNQMRDVSTVFLDVVFSDSEVAQHTSSIDKRMSIAFALGYEGRDAIIESLREDVAQKGRVDNVVLLQAGRFFSMKPGKRVANAS
jgi:hypothetical protein